MKRTNKLNQHRDTVADRDIEIHRLIAEIEADERVLRHRRMQLETRLAGTPACNAHDITETVRGELTTCATMQAGQDPRRQKLAADVAYDLWRFSCEMPDARNWIKD